MSNIIFQPYKFSRVITTKHVQPLSNVKKSPKRCRVKNLTPKTSDMHLFTYTVHNQA